MSKHTTSHRRYSIVIPAYNEAQYIAETIRSLQRQTYNKQVEIIVVDNNSTDETAAIARSCGATVLREKNVGVCFARQRGTEAATGDVVISTDADTIFDDDWLQNIDTMFNEKPNLVAIAGGCVFMDAPKWGVVYPILLFSLVDVLYKLTGYTLYASATNIAFKKAAWSGYDTKMTQGGDELGLLRTLRKSGPVCFYYKNPTYTSSRRLTKGFAYNFFVSFLIYYILEYNLSRILKRPVLGSYPKFRDISPLRQGQFTFPIGTRKAKALNKETSAE